MDVQAQAFKVDARTQRRFSVGNTVIRVHVRPLDAIRIVASSNRLVVNGEQTLQVIGFQPAEVPFSWGNLRVRFAWSAAQSKAVDLKPVYSSADVSLGT